MSDESKTRGVSKTSGPGRSPEVEGMSQSRDVRLTTTIDRSPLR